jgi:hypothetical protein
MNTLSRIGLLLTISCLMSSVVAKALTTNEVIIKPDEVIAHCGKFMPVAGETYKWIEKDVDLTSSFSGYPNMSSGFISQKSNQLCASQVDPAGFPHHISKARQCQLKILYLAPQVGGRKVVLSYSGCYLPSSKRVPSRPIALMAVPIRKF